MRTPTRIPLPWLIAAALVALASCDKGHQKPPGEAASGKAASMTPPVGRTPPRRIAVSTHVLPIPADLAALRFNVEKLRTTAWFKRDEAKVRQALLGGSALAKALQACKVDPIRQVEGATLGARQVSGKRADVIVILKIPGLAPTLLTCLQARLTAAGIRVGELTLASRSGIAFTLDGRDAAVVRLRSEQLLIVLGGLRGRVADVLAGRAPSIASTSLYKEANGQVGPDSLFGGIVPGMLTEGCKGLPPLLRSFRTGALLVNLPRGQSTLKVNLHFEDKARAASVAKRIPALLQLAATRHANTPSQPPSAQARPSKGWTYLDFALDDRAFAQLLSLVQSLLGPSTGAPAPTRGAKTAPDVSGPRHRPSKRAPRRKRQPKKGR